MIVIDTNIILRILLNDNPLHLKHIASYIANHDTETWYVDSSSIAECIYIAYKQQGIGKADVANRLITLLARTFAIHMADPVLESLRLWGSNSLDYVDCYLIALAHDNDYELFSLDKKMNKLYQSMKQD